METKAPTEPSHENLAGEIPKAMYFFLVTQLHGGLLNPSSQLMFPRSSAKLSAPRASLVEHVLESYEVTFA